MIQLTINMWVAIIAWAALAFGVLARKKRAVHVPLVGLGITLDLFLVAYLAITRNAVQSALAFNLPLLSQAHICASSIAVLFYFPTVYFGTRLLFGLETSRTRFWHRRFAVTAFIFRTLGLVLMFSLTNSSSP